MRTVYKNSAMVLTILVGIAPLRADERLVDARAAVSQWIEVERTLSREAMAWEDKNTLLNDMLAVAQTQIASLKKSIAATEQATGATEERRAELVTQREANAKLTEKLTGFVVRMENRVRGVAGRLPAPLTEKVTPLLRRMPDDPAKTELGVAARMQTVLAFLAELQRFDTMITVGEEIRSTEGGGAREVRTIHFGLGVAYYVSADGADAGIGRPGEDGWIWEARPDVAASVQEAIATAEGRQREARFVSLPVTVKEESR